jgi:hypothetical protein
MLRSPKDMVNLLQNNSKFKLNPYNQRFINRIVTNTILNMISLVDLVTKRPLTPTVMSFVMEEKKKKMGCYFELCELWWCCFVRLPRVN